MTSDNDELGLDAFSFGEEDIADVLATDVRFQQARLHGDTLGLGARLQILQKLVPFSLQKPYGFGCGIIGTIDIDDGDDMQCFGGMLCQLKGLVYRCLGGSATVRGQKDSMNIADPLLSGMT